MDSGWGKLPVGERCVRYMAGFGSGVSYGVHANCLKNMVRGIAERVLYVRRGERLVRPPQPKEGVFGRLSSLRERLVRKLNSTPIVERDDYPLLYSGRKQRVYQAAVDSLKTRGLTVADSFVSTFLKAEKVNFTAKVDPAPRVIQPRSSRFNVEVGRYLKLFEKELFAGFKRLFGYSVVVKGMNAQQVGALFAEHWDRYKDPVGVGLDASRFDQHVSVDALRFEHSVYNAVFHSPELARLLRMQLHNRGIARVGGYRLDYTVEGCRMSGDMNTGMGNCLLMSLILIAYCEQHGIDCRVANNGDDCVAFLERRDLPKLCGLDQWYLDFGFTLTREAPVDVLEKVEFCQAQPVQCANGWRMVRNPHTAMSKDMVSLLGWSQESEIRDWAAAISSCGVALTAGVPVWEQWYRSVGTIGLGSSSAGVTERVRECGMYHLSKGVTACEVDDVSRASFWRAFGISPDMQVHLEEEYRRPFELRPLAPVMTCVPAVIDQQNPLTLST